MYAAEVRPGDDVVVVGIGGIGINAVQGAKIAGARQIFAIDPLQFKREKAVEFGATHTASSIEEAADLIGEATNGRMATKVILTLGLGQGEMIGAALAVTSKGGRVVVTNIHPFEETQVSMSALDLTLMQKQVVGALFGSASPRADIPRLLDLYARGLLKLDELVTRTYDLAEVNQGYDDMRNGANLRGVIKF